VSVETGRLFARELNELRRRQGVSVRELARRSGVSVGYVGNLLAGRRGHRPSDGVLARLAAALGVEADHFTEYRRRRLLERHPELVDELYERVRPR
jgi:transcriptional regulator with XRE-family HTH domain